MFTPPFFYLVKNCWGGGQYTVYIPSGGAAGGLWYI